MTDRYIDGFFYGLFMDRDILRDSGVTVENPRRAYVDEFALVIGNRATLVPNCGGRAYGMVFSLTHCGLDRLYSSPGLEQYRPEAVVAHSLEGVAIPALCYNLLEVPGYDEINTQYAARLQTVLSKLEFPPEYIKSIL